MYKTKIIFGFATKVPIHSKICVIGGGTAGLSVVSQLCNEKEIFQHQVRVFEPSRTHIYQPNITALGGGLGVSASSIKKRVRDLFNYQIPITEYKVEKVDPTKNQLTTEDGQVYSYDQLVIASGNQLKFDQIKGATEALENIDCPVTSVYDFKYGVKTQKMAKQFKGGLALFTQAPMPIKCAGAPQKIVFLLEDQWKKKSVNKQIQFHSASNVVFGVKKYSDALQKQHDQKNNQIVLQSNLVEVKGEQQVAVFQNLQTQELSEVKFDFLHLTPPQTPPKFIKDSGLGNEAGYVDVDQNTLQHKIYQNIWSLGDSSSLPTSKTAAATFSQAPVLVQNLISQSKKEELKAFYDGYSACPIYVGGNKLILAEFLYQGETKETFWGSQDQPSYFLFLLKRYFFGMVYWWIVPRGKWFGRNGIIKPQY